MVEHYNITKTLLNPDVLNTAFDRTHRWMMRWLNIEVSSIANQVNPMILPLAASEKSQCPVRMNQQGWNLLKQFQRVPSYSEQSVREIEQAVLRQVKVPLTSNQFSALVSLTYNLGEANLKRSELLIYLNAGCYQAAADEFERWVYVGPKCLPELVTRRIAEKQLFLQTER
jgi:GH24 family phage-related lysozyme (muramidase)